MLVLLENGPGSDCGPFKLGEADENANGTGSNDDYSSDEGLKIKK